MSMTKKILAVAIVTGLFATSANAAVNIGTNSGAVKIASELDPASAGTDITNAANALDIISSVSQALSNTEVRYARFECDSNVKFKTGSTAGYTDGGGSTGTATLGAINGLGTNAISFSVTATATGVGDNTGDIFTIYGDRTLTSNAAASCTYSLYDQPSQASTGGTTGRIVTKTGSYIASESGYSFTSTVGDLNTANVEADPAFTKFVTISGQTTVTTARLAKLVFDVKTGTQLDYDGTDVTLADLFAAGTNIKVSGDFSLAQNDGGTYNGTALTRVFLNSSADCTGTSTNASTLASNQATFTVGATANTNQYLCVTAEGTPEIVSSTYEATLVAVEATPATYNVVNTGPSPAGEITRNGTELQAPLAQVPGNGWLSRMVLTNTGTIARPYTIKVLRETGNTGTTSNLTGTVPGNGTIVVDLSSVLPTFTAGSRRATLNVTVAGPNKQIQGLYQIVNTSSNSISNHAMIRPGTN